MDAMTPDEDLGEQGTEEEAPRTMEIDIDPPITFAKKEFTRLYLKEPTMAQQANAEKELGNQPNPYTVRRFQIALVAGVAKVPREVVEQMRVSQIEAATVFLGALSSAGPRTGET
jgi:hypothetical protein